jgi:hypothetical protein
MCRPSPHSAAHRARSATVRQPDEGGAPAGGPVVGLGELGRRIGVGDDAAADVRRWAAELRETR